MKFLRQARDCIETQVPCRGDSEASEKSEKGQLCSPRAQNKLRRRVGLRDRLKNSTGWGLGFRVLGFGF